MRASVPGLVAVIAASSMLMMPLQITAQQHVNPSAVALAEFTKRVQAYIDLHNAQASALPAAKPTTNPNDVIAREKMLAERLTIARAGAKQGDIFVPESVAVFKQVFAAYYQRRTGREKRLVFDEVPNFTPRVNMVYPVSAPKATFPPRLALTLPQLPDKLEYRIVSNDLILRDTEANIVVDFIPGMLPASDKS
jgi:hypothetical protein